MRRVFLFAGLWACLCAPLLAETPVTDVIPADATNVVSVKSPKSVLRRINGYLQAKENADVMHPWLVEVLPKNMGELVNSAQSVSLVVLRLSETPKGDMKDVVAIVAATQDDAEFRKQVLKLGGKKETDTFFFRVGDYLVVCESKYSAVVEKSFKEKSTSLSQRLSREDRNLFQKGDISAYVNVPTVLPGSIGDRLAKEIKSLKEGPFTWEPDSLGPLATLAGLISAPCGRLEVNVLQALVDAEQSVATVQMDENGILFDGVVRFKKDSISAKTMQTNPPGSMAAIRRVPGKHQFAVQFHGNMKLLFQETLQLLPEAKADSPFPIKCWRATLNELSELKPASVAASLGIGDPERGAIELRTLVDVNQPERLEAWWRRLCETQVDVGFENYSEDPAFPTFSLTSRLKMASQSEQYNDRKVSVASLDVAPTPRGFFEFRRPVGEAQLAPYKMVLNVLGGPQGLHFRSVNLTDRWLLTIGGTKLETADAIRRADRSGAGVTDAVDQTVSQLWPEANLMVLLDYPNFERGVLQVYEKFQPGIRAAFGQNRPLKPAGNPSFLGLAFRNEPQTLRGRIYIPATQIEEIKAGSLYLQLIMQGFNMAVQVEAQPAEEAQPVKEKE